MVHLTNAREAAFQQFNGGKLAPPVAKKGKPEGTFSVEFAVREYLA